MLAPQNHRVENVGLTQSLNFFYDYVSADLVTRDLFPLPSHRAFPNVAATLLTVS